MGGKGARKTARTPRDRVLRYIGLIVGIFIGWLIGWLIGARISGEGSVDEWGPLAIIFAAGFGGIFWIIAPYVTVGFVNWLRRKFAAVPAIDIVAAGVGLVVGGILSSLLALPTSLLPDPFGQYLPFKPERAAWRLRLSKRK